jgi:hypothetical protein
LTDKLEKQQRKHDEEMKVMRSDRLHLENDTQMLRDELQVVKRENDNVKYQIQEERERTAKYKQLME